MTETKTLPEIAREILVKIHTNEAERCMGMGDAALNLIHPMLVEEKHQHNMKELVSLVKRLLK